MYWIVLIVLSGFAVGYVLRKQAIIKHSGWLLRLSVYVLLFLMGISIGTQPALIERLPHIGLTALIITVSGVLGSCLLALWIYRILRKRASDETQ